MASSVIKTDIGAAHAASARARESSARRRLASNIRKFQEASLASMEDPENGALGYDDARCMYECCTELLGGLESGARTEDIQWMFNDGKFRTDGEMQQFAIACRQRDFRESGEASLRLSIASRKESHKTLVSCYLICVFAGIVSLAVLLGFTLNNAVDRGPSFRIGETEGDPQTACRRWLIEQMPYKNYLEMEIYGPESIELRPSADWEASVRRIAGDGAYEDWYGQEGVLIDHSNNVLLFPGEVRFRARVPETTSQDEDYAELLEVARRMMVAQYLEVYPRAREKNVERLSELLPWWENAEKILDAGIYSFSPSRRTMRYIYKKMHPRSISIDDGQVKLGFFFAGVVWVFAFIAAYFIGGIALMKSNYDAHKEEERIYAMAGERMPLGNDLHRISSAAMYGYTIHSCMKMLR